MEDSSKPPPRPGGRSRNKQKRRPRNRARGMPQTQQVKVTLRKIENVEKFGSVSQILGMVQTIVHNVNEENKGKAIFLPIHLEEASIQRLVQEEQLAEAAKAKQEAETENVEETETMEVEGVQVQEPDSNNKETAKDSKQETPTTENPKLLSSIVKGEEQQQEVPKGPVIYARALYVVPPKKSRRRGIKSGCAYLVLNGPKVAETEEEYATMTQFQKSRATAKARLQLTMAIDALSAHGAEDAKTNQRYGGCIIEQSTSGKAWKPNHRDNREGTIETTADYKRFMSRAEKEEEERMSRPRPTPGGAMGDMDGAENGEPVAAIVRHLQAKRKQEARRRKAAMKKNEEKEPKGKKKGGASKDGSKSSRGGRSSKKKDRKKKSEAPKPPPMPAPAMMSTSEFPTL